jgi:predicted TIM-barrel fold metal-dependent hydrolase
MHRRQFALAAVASLAVGAATVYGLKKHYGNACAGPADEGHQLDPELMARVWRGLDPAKVLDCHVHLAGLGGKMRPDRPWTNPALTTPANPFLFAHFALFADASCVTERRDAADDLYVDRLVHLVREFPAGVRFMLFALDGACRPDGMLDTERSVMWVPNAYARNVARRDPARFGWAASVNPLRPDAISLVRRAARDGARALKWIPYLMDIDPASPRFNGFYDVLAELRLPLIVHAGWEHELLQGGHQEYGNPLCLRRALDRGVKVVMAHCATQGDFADIDTGQGMTSRPSFDLFRRMIDEPAYRNLLSGDISAIVESGRAPETLRELIQHPRWKGRLVNGSDYPLPGVRLAVSAAHLASEGLLDANLPPLIDHIQQHNPLLFDFVLKRCMSWQGAAFPEAVFECAGLFDRARH